MSAPQPEHDLHQRYLVHMGTASAAALAAALATAAAAVAVAPAAVAPAAARAAASDVLRARGLRGRLNVWQDVRRL